MSMTIAAHQVNSMGTVLKTNCKNNNDVSYSFSAQGSALEGSPGQLDRLQKALRSCRSTPHIVFVTRSDTKYGRRRICAFSERDDCDIARFRSRFHRRRGGIRLSLRQAGKFGHEPQTGMTFPNAGSSQARLRAPGGRNDRLAMRLDYSAEPQISVAVSTISASLWRSTSSVSLLP